MKIEYLLSSMLSVLCVVPAALACTSAIVWGDATPDRLSILWKNRDTGCHDNFVERVGATDRTHGYVALFNAGDSLLAEAWAGVNDVGFGIINTASYNLVPDTAVIRDREGVLMTAALQSCETMSDFGRLLDAMPRPLGVHANFGVTDRYGGVAYYEACDTGYVCYAGTPSDKGMMLRTNYSYAGDTVDAGLGYLRHEAARHLIRPAADNGCVTPQMLVGGVSRSFYHALYGRDMLETAVDGWLVDQDFIPRYSTSASVAIVSGDDTHEPYMLVALGYPPCAGMSVATPQFVPDDLRPLVAGCRSEAAVRAAGLKRRVFCISRGSGNRYINVEALRHVMDMTRPGDR